MNEQRNHHVNTATIYWFKNDQRLTDNEALCHAIAFNQPVIPVYIIDPRNFEMTEYGFRKTSYIRYQFLLESLTDLKQRLQSLGADLDIVLGYPEVLIPDMVSKHNVNRIFCEEEYAQEELEVITKLEKQLPAGCELLKFWGKTLYHLEDIPYSIENIPKTSKAYRINTTKKTAVRSTFKQIAPFKTLEKYEFHDVSSAWKEKLFNTDEIKIDHEFIVPAGETQGLKRLEYYTFGSQLLTSYKWTRNKSQGLDYSSKLSPYLALGNISPRTIYETVKSYEETIAKNKSTWWLVFEVVWRDFFTFRGMHFGNSIFKTAGFKKKEIIFENNQTYFEAWKNGMTGIPFIDAHMRQLNKTGFMSNRGRVNCASFLVHDLKIDWTWGASYFESKLIDYDVSANWLNWHMQAYEIWYTNPVNQAQKYKAGAFIKEYVPELQGLSENQVLAPWIYGTDTKYPKPIVMFSKWNRAINIIKELNLED